MRKIANLRTRIGRTLALACVPLMIGVAEAHGEPRRLTFDQSRSVYGRRVQPPEPVETVHWEERVSGWLREQPGDIIVTAVGDMIFKEHISRLPDPAHQQLFRLMEEADIAQGNLEFSIDSHPEPQRPFYNVRAEPEFAWEPAAIGINMVRMSNTHALDVGPEGRRVCLRALDRANITHAGAGMTLAAARAPGSMGVQSRTTRFGLLSSVRYWTQKYRCTDPGSA